MLFGKRKHIVKRILVVEDEPLTAFDTETLLVDLGYEVVATLDDHEVALAHIEREPVDLIICDVKLHEEDFGIDLARAAKARGIPTLLATGYEPPDASCLAIGCLKKPWTDRQLKHALNSIERHLSGRPVKPRRGLELYLENPA